MISLPNVAIIELGSQYTLVIERTLRELGVRSVILDPKRAKTWLKNNSLKAVIFSGGAASVYDNDAPQPPVEVFSLTRQDGQPVAILGICYGMQWLAQHLGGHVKEMPHNREYGKAHIICDFHHNFFADTPIHQEVWMSHGDSVTSLPEGFSILAHSDTNTVAAIARDSIFGVQFHPEVTHTPYGKTMLKNFLQFAGCQSDWQPTSIVASIQEDVAKKTW